MFLVYESAVLSDCSWVLDDLWGQKVPAQRSFGREHGKTRGLNQGIPDGVLPAVRLQRAHRMSAVFPPDTLLFWLQADKAHGGEHNANEGDGDIDDGCHAAPPQKMDRNRSAAAGV
ncbi:hypothetical protein [Levilinea saccharolytica]|uniref:hypothetical protein n=1 Tax=Levilinea saccharolytica TaxID=229921 RepID=UPI0011BF1C3A|nr:hypothetical protein [Levilinea saccharolytica]